MSSCQREAKRIVARSLYLVLLGATALPPFCFGEATPVRPNILFIVVDTLRYDHVGCNGYQRPTTPHIDELAASGCRFSQAIASSSWTMPSVASMFTSVPPSVHGVVSAESKIPDALTTLAAELERSGYLTAGITSNPMTRHQCGYAKGFGFYDDHSIVAGAELDPFGDGEAQGGINKSVSSDDVTRLAIRWLTGRRDATKPFFLHLLYFDPHDLYVPPPEYRKLFTDEGPKTPHESVSMTQLRSVTIERAEQEHLVGLYDAEVRHTDDQIGRLLDGLAKAGVAESTIVCVVADHGEEFWDHGSASHGHTLYEELVHVPLVMCGPGVVAHRTVETQVSLLDLMPTMLELAGAPTPDQCQGQSLRPWLEGRLGTGTEYVKMEAQTTAPLLGLRSASRKVVEREDSEKRELYDLATDPLERTNLAGTLRASEFVYELQILSEWKASRASRGQPKEGFKVTVDPLLKRQLESLGYAR